jgi:hypothetical protein
MRWLMVFGALAFSAAVAPGAAAQRELGEDEARRSTPHYEAVKEASARGREMYLYDQAAWHATDRFLEDWGSRATDWLRGYLVEPGDDDRLTAVFFGEQDGKLVEAARYRVAGSDVIDGGPHDEVGRPELSSLGKRMIDARQAAFEEAAEQEFGLCSRSPPNTLILPPGDDGTISVYLLTAPTETDSYPIGGHYRLDIGADGEILASRRFLNTCFAANYGAARDEEGNPMTPEMLVVTHLLDPHPTEIHSFASYYVPVTLMVVTTENRLLWSVRQGNIGYMGPVGGSGDEDLND